MSSGRTEGIGDAERQSIKFGTVGAAARWLGGVDESSVESTGDAAAAECLETAASADAHTSRGGRDAIGREAADMGPPESVIGTFQGNAEAFQCRCPAAGLDRCRYQRQGNNRSETIRAPSRKLISFAQTTSSATRPQPAEVSNPQSVPARTRDGSPTTATTLSIRSATTSGCSTKFVKLSMTPATRI